MNDVASINKRAARLRARDAKKANGPSLEDKIHRQKVNKQNKEKKTKKRALQRQVKRQIEQEKRQKEREGQALGSAVPRLTLTAPGPSSSVFVASSTTTSRVTLTAPAPSNWVPAESMRRPTSRKGGEEAGPSLTYIPPSKPKGLKASKRRQQSTLMSVGPYLSSLPQAPHNFPDPEYTSLIDQVSEMHLD